MIAVLLVFAILLLVADVAVRYVHQRRALDNFREVEKERTRRLRR